MTMTIKELADELGIDKQRVYRFIKRNHITEAHHDAGTFYYDDVAKELIRKHFLSETTSSESHQSTSSDIPKNDEVLFLRSELKQRNTQIDMLQKLLDQQQVLTLQANKKIAELETTLTQNEDEPKEAEPQKTEPEKKSFWQRLFH